jgi:hypothetical protein
MPARAADERVLNAADPKTPFPGELTVGSMEAVPARAAAEGVEDAADPKPPFPKELTVGFPGESKAPTVALMVHATAVAIGGLLAVDSGMEKGVEKGRRLDSLMGWEQLESKEPSSSVSFCRFVHGWRCFALIR